MQNKTSENITFETWINLAKDYYMTYGNLRVSQKYVTPTGEKLGIWIANQRQKYATGLLSTSEIIMLEKAGMIWNVREEDWNNMYNLAAQYYNTHHDLKIPAKYVTKDKKPLGRWLVAQRQAYLNGTLSPEKQAKLEAIGITWQINADKWLKMYNLALEYYNEYGNLKVSQAYITPNNEALGVWIQVQRQDYASSKISLERINLLEKIGMIWKLQDDKWDETFKKVKKYYEEHQSLSGLRDITLLNWLTNQRRSYRKNKLSEAKIKALESIGMSWGVKVNTDIKAYLEELKTRENPIIIDEKINKEVLMRISLLELQSKIEFLVSNGLSPVDNKGKLVDIFTMSSPDIKNKYGLSLEEIIEKYNKIDTKPNQKTLNLPR